MSRLADPGEGISADELALAGRNHALLLEAMRYDITPPGLHYVLVHYDVPYIETTSWSLSVGGHVNRPFSLDLDMLRSFEPVTLPVTMECAGNGRAHLEPRPVSQPWLEGAVGTAVWTGARLADVLAEAEPRAGAVDVVLTGADHGVERGVEQDYARGLSMAEATRPDVLLAYEMNGAPLPPQHGFPLRAVVPGWYGMTSVKWLRSITVMDTPYDGFQNAVAYRYKRDFDDTGDPVTRIAVRALMIPPGFPDFGSRGRIVEAGRVVLTGRAWSGRGVVNKVEVSYDGGEAWSDADLEPAWNAQGMANNGIQRVPVHVR
jgi:DMSO/TMAO reductase YedYZ molybdopterin-dependent catalytic subunit